MEELGWSLGGAWEVVEESIYGRESKSKAFCVAPYGRESKSKAFCVAPYGRERRKSAGGAGLSRNRRYLNTVRPVAIVPFQNEGSGAMYARICNSS